MQEQNLNTPYAGIIEVVGVRQRRANLLLSGGYRLLSVVAITREAVRKKADVQGATYIERSVLYVVGRPEGVAQVPLDEGERAESEERRRDGYAPPGYLPSGRV